MRKSSRDGEIPLFLIYVMNCERCKKVDSRMLVVNNKIWNSICEKFNHAPSSIILCPECMIELLGRELKPGDLVMDKIGRNGKPEQRTYPCNSWFLNKHKDWIKELQEPILNHLRYYRTTKYWRIGDREDVLKELYKVRLQNP